MCADAVRILSGDIGATHSRFALYVAEHAGTVDAAGTPPLTLLGSRVLKSADRPSFNAALHALFTDGEDGPALLDPARLPDAAVIAPAGPIEGPPGDERCRMTNLPWLIKTSDLRDLLGTDRVRLINDLEALAWACLLPEAVAARLVVAGTARPGAPAAVVAAGTGFGQALLLRPPETEREAAGDFGRFARARVLPAEGGHAEFPFVGAREFAFAAFAAARLGTDRPIRDHIVGGAGLTHILAFLGGPDVGPVEAAAICPHHPEALEWYARFYGRACRNFVLDTLALGGVYIAGGMAARLGVLESPAFVAEFRADSHPSALVHGVPVFHVRDPHAGLFGAAFFGMLRFCGHLPAE
jgi:glucokinase